MMNSDHEDRLQELEMYVNSLETKTQGLEEYVRTLEAEIQKQVDVGGDDIQKINTRIDSIDTGMNSALWVFAFMILSYYGVFDYIWDFTKGIFAIILALLN